MNIYQGRKFKYVSAFILKLLFISAIILVQTGPTNAHQNSIKTEQSNFQVNNRECINFSTVNLGDSIEGFGAVHPYLNIGTTNGNAISLAEGTDPFAYASNGQVNFRLGNNGGFSDATQNHQYTFTFAQNVTVSNFSIRMLDYGDFNPVGATQHQVQLIGYNSNHVEVDRSVLNFESDGAISEEDELWQTGDASTDEGNPGNYVYDIQGNSISTVFLNLSSELGVGATDPLFGLADLCFEIESSIITPPSSSMCINFAQLPVGSSVEGLGTLHEWLEISTSSGQAVALQESQDPFAYRSRFGVNNFGMGALGGFADASKVHDYSFTFAPDISISQFSIRMLDYGDYNAIGATEHQVHLVGYDANNNEVARDTLSFNSDGEITEDDELWMTGDATAANGSIGNYVFSISSNNIVRVEMEYDSNGQTIPSDPLHGLAVLCFEPENAPPTPPASSPICADFTQLPVGSSVEGLGTLHEWLEISTSSGLAVALRGGQDPFAYRSRFGVNNFGMGALGGFADASKTHDYSFTFAPDISISQFNLHMLDYGDYNAIGATEHQVHLVGYDANNNEVARDTLSFTSDGEITEDDELWITGDATAAYGDPGNFIFSLDGNGIVRVEMEYDSDGQAIPSDPLHGLAVLCFEPEPTPPPIPPNSICADFTQLPVGSSVEGLGTLHEWLEISTSSGQAVALQESQDPFAYRSRFGVNNFGMGALGGFADASKTHDYSFTFAPNVSISQFNLHMLDYGDYNAIGATEHQVHLVGYDANNNEVARDTLSFTSDGEITEDDELWITGDATAAYGDPGNFIFSLDGDGIVRVEMEYDSDGQAIPSDPLHGLAVLCFLPENAPPPPPPNSICADFTQLPVGSSVEGLGTLHHWLNISTSSGQAVALQESQDPFAYRSRFGVNNFGMGALGGFADASKTHDYSFTFAPNVSISQFNLHMLDYGDYNAIGATEHQVHLVGYDANNNEVARDTLSFTSDGEITEDDELWITGDATAAYGDPGNFIFSLDGNGIVRVEMEYDSDGQAIPSDPLHGLAVLCFEPENAPPPPPPNSICADFTQLPVGSSVEGLGTLHHWLNISTSSGQAVALQESQDPFAYRSRFGVNNFGMGALGGFADASEAHDYSFTFAPNVSISQFNLHMLDYGDYNAIGATEHQVHLVGYDANNNEVARDTLSFTSDGEITEDDELWITGDATAAYGDPGNFIFSLDGDGIVRVEMEYDSDGQAIPSDPLHGLAVLCFEPEDSDPEPPNEQQICADFGLETVGTANWDRHIIRDMSPVDLEFVRPFGADFAIVNTGWGWSGFSDQQQVTEMHSVNSSIGSALSDDYGDAELEGQIIWFDSLATDYDDSLLNVTLNYAGNGDDRGSHRSYGEVLWCAENVPEYPPTEFETCEDMGMTQVGWDSWTWHIIRDKEPTDITFNTPEGANHLLINTGWEWTGRENQAQVTEMHSVSSPIGSTVSEDYGDEELAGTVYWYDLLQGAFDETELTVSLDYAGDGSDSGSHRSHGMIKWCYDDGNNNSDS